MNVENYVIKQSKEYFAKSSSFCETPDQLFDMLYNCGIIDFKRLRIAVIKQEVNKELSKGITKLQAYANIAEEFGQAESTIENICRNSFYKAIEFVE